MDPSHPATCVPREEALSEVVPIPSHARIAGAQEHQLTIDNVTWRYLTAGSGPPLLLVHGLMGYAWSWRFNMEELGRYFTVYAPDLPGCGFSQRSDSLPGTLQSDAEALLKFMDHLAVGEFHLLGTSRGGGVSIVLAGLLAQRGLQRRVPRIILSAPISPWSKFGQGRARLLATALGQAYTVHGAKRMPWLLEKYYRRLYGDTSRIAEGSLAGYKAGLDVPGSFQQLARIMRIWHSDLKQVADSLPLIQEFPILLLWGDCDSAVYPSSAYELYNRLANSTLLMMNGVGHLPYEEVPADFNRIVCDFLLRHKPPTPFELGDSGQTVNRIPPAGTSIEPEPQQAHIAR